MQSVCPATIVAVVSCFRQIDVYSGSIMSAIVTCFKLLLSVFNVVILVSATSQTRSQAVARIADRTAAQHLWGHLTSSVTRTFDSPCAISYCWSFGTRPLSLTVSDIFYVECNAMVGMTLIRPLNKGQGHSFWYQSISHATSYRLSIVTFALGCTV